MLCFLTQPQKELYLDLKTNNTRTVRKLNCIEVQHQGLKGATFILTGRRGKDTETRGEVQRHSVAQRRGGDGGRTGDPTSMCGG